LRAVAPHPEGFPGVHRVPESVFLSGMKALFAPLTLALACFAWLSAGCSSDESEEGFVSMFNGRDLSGWVNANCAPETWSVRDGRIYCTGFPTGGLRTTRHYENFILEVEWRHLTSGGNSGIFIWGSPINAPGVPFLRGIEVQALDHGYAEQYEQRTGKKGTHFTVHGDVFPIHGATMTPLPPTNGRRGFPREERSKPSPEWNHYRIVANNGSIRLHVNGKEVSGGDDCNYRKGYLALESEGAPVEFRNIRIKELPSTGAGPEVTAPLDPGWQSFFNSLDLRGWRTSPDVSARWEVVREKLVLKAGRQDEAATLWSEGEFGDAEFIVDFQPLEPAAGEAASPAGIFVRGGHPVPLVGAVAGRFSRFTVTVQGSEVRVQRDDGTASELTLPGGTPARGGFGLAAGGGGTFTNLNARTL
jgi:hypothetical protein